jgi:hypothetical protein
MIMALTPFVRIALFVFTGFLLGSTEHQLVSIIAFDPELVASVTGAVVALWYAYAKWRGLPT